MYIHTILVNKTSYEQYLSLKRLLCNIEVDVYLLNYSDASAISRSDFMISLSTNLPTFWTKFSVTSL